MGNYKGLILKGRSYENKIELFHDKGPYHIETSPLISSKSQRTGFYTICTSVMKEVK